MPQGDRLWIQGLTITNSKDTHFVRFSTYSLGFIPNGNRIYYTNRSQPPFFIPSVYHYLQTTDDFDFVKPLLPILEKEYMFWMANKSVEVQKSSGGSGETFTLNRYYVTTDNPRQGINAYRVYQLLLLFFFSGFVIEMITV